MSDKKQVETYHASAEQEWMNTPIEVTKKRRITARNAFNTARGRAIRESGLSPETREKFLRR